MIALKIEGSVDFSLLSGQKAVRLGAENTTTRGPSYTRRQIKRLMQRQMGSQMPQSTSSETVGGKERGGPGYSNNKSYPVRDLRSAKIKKSQAERKTQTPVAGMDPPPPGPSVLRNFNPGIFGTGFLQNPGIPGFSGTGLTYFFHPGIDGIPGFFGTGLA